MDYELWFNRAKISIESDVEIGKKFEVKHLFQGLNWESLSKGERINFGRYFSDAVKEGRLEGVEKCESGKSHHCQYIKKGVNSNEKINCIIYDVSTLSVAYCV